VTFCFLFRLLSGEELPSAAYLKTVALNIVRDRWRQTRSRGTLLPLEEALLSSHSEEPAFAEPLIEELMGRLSEEQRMVLQLRIIDGYSRAETARKMKRSEDSVRGLQYRAVKNLRELMLQELARRR